MVKLADTLGLGPSSVYKIGLRVQVPFLATQIYK